MKTKIYFLLSTFCFQLLAWGGLSATVQPGYTFGADEVPTIDNLNLLGLPTISVYGTVDGSNGVAPNSLTGDQLVDAFPDDSTLQWYGSGPRRLRVKAGGIGTNELNPAAFTAPLTGGSNNLVTLATNSITANYLRTNWLDTVTVITNPPVNVNTNWTGTNTFVLLATSTTVTNGAPTNTTFNVITLTNLYTALGVPTAASLPAVGAMVKFSGTATGTHIPGDGSVLRSVNVSNVVRNSQGNYTINFTNSFANTNYVVTWTMDSEYANANSSIRTHRIYAYTNSLNLVLSGWSGTYDPYFVHVIIHP